MASSVVAPCEMARALPNVMPVPARLRSAPATPANAASGRARPSVSVSADSPMARSAHHQRVSLRDLDHEDHATASRALAQRELYVAKEAGAEQAVSSQLERRVVDVQTSPRRNGT